MDCLDVHKMTLDNAIKLIKEQVNIAYENGMAIVHVNHGFNKGTKIKSWCLNNGSTLEHVLKVTTGENEGITDFYIDTSKYLKKILKK